MIISDDIGMHAVTSMFEKPESAVRFMSAGNDMMMVCAHWTDTERARELAKGMIEGIESGALARYELERSRERIANMLERTPQNKVQSLSEDIFRNHAEVGTLFSETTVEVI
jgi:beta-N-acetylhexosaminidase